MSDERVIEMRRPIFTRMSG